MKKVIALISLVLLFASTQAFADDHYFKAGAGLSFVPDSDLDLDFDVGGGVTVGEISSNTGFALHTALGTSFKNGAAIELEYGFKKSGLDKITSGSVSADLDGNIKVNTLMVNGLYNFENSTMFTPYGGLGLGIAWAKISDDTDDSNSKDTNFAVQLLAGVSTEVANGVDFSLGYRWLNAGSISEKVSIGTASMDIDTHSFEAGIKYSF